MLCVTMIAAAFALQSPPPPESPAASRAASEYLAGWKAAERKALGMTKEHAAAFKAAEHKRLARQVSQKYGVAESDLRRAVREEEARRARPRGRVTELETMSQARASTRAYDAVPGAVGTMDARSFLASNYLAAEEAVVFFAANDSAGLKQLVDRKLATLSGEGQRCRVLERFDYRSIGKGLFVRVRLIGGPNDGKEAHAFPEQIDFGTPVVPASADRSRR